MYYYNLLHRIHAIQTSEHPSIERDSLNPYANKSRCSDKFVGLLIKENGILKKRLNTFLQPSRLKNLVLYDNSYESFDRSRGILGTYFGVGVGKI